MLVLDSARVYVKLNTFTLKQYTRVFAYVTCVYENLILYNYLYDCSLYIVQSTSFNVNSTTCNKGWTRHLIC